MNLLADGIHHSIRTLIIESTNTRNGPKNGGPDSVNKAAGRAAENRVGKQIGQPKLGTMIKGRLPDFAQSVGDGYRINEVKYVQRLGGTRVFNQLKSYIGIANLSEGGSVSVWVPESLNLETDVSQNIQELIQTDQITIERIPGS